MSERAVAIDEALEKEPVPARAPNARFDPFRYLTALRQSPPGIKSFG